MFDTLVRLISSEWANQLQKQSKVLVTGGTSGLGLRLVKLFLKKGYEVVATGRQPADNSSKR